MKKESMGKIVKELAPDFEKENPRNSEGAFLTLRDGRILFVYSRFKGADGADYAASDLYGLYSYDDGDTFGDGRILVTCEEEEAMNIMSVSLLHMQAGDIGMFYLVRKTKTSLQMYLRRSSDGGKSWGPHVLCTPTDGVFVVNNDRVVRLSNGDILIPAASHRPTEDFFEEFGELCFFYSQDDGRTWKMSAGRCSIPRMANCESGLQEPGVIELTPGVLWCWARTDLGRQYESFSCDYGRSWSICQPSRFTSPKSPLSMKRIPIIYGQAEQTGTEAEGNRQTYIRTDDNCICAVWNPVPEYNGREYPEGIFLGGRSPYVVAFSRDNGKSFTVPTAFESDENSGYCYCAMHVHRGSLLLAYCAGSMADGSCLVRCRIRKIEYEQLLRE